MREGRDRETSRSPGLDARGLTVGAILGLLYTAALSTLCLLRHRAFHSHAFDLGLHHQATWNAAHGNGLSYTLFYAFHPQLTCLLGDHVNLILFPAALLYRIWDGPETLLVLQALVVGSAAIPLVGLSRRLLGSTGLGVGFAAVFFYHPAIQAANLADFHAVLPAAAFIIWAFYFAEVGSQVGLAVALVLALSCQENVALVVALFGGWLFLRGRRRAGSLVFLLGLAWFAVCLFWILPAFNPAAGSNHFVGRYGHLGATPGQAARNLVLHPTLYLGRLAEPRILSYLFAVFAPTGLLGFLAPEVLLVAGSELGLSILSSYPAQQSIETQYASIVVAVATVAAIYGTGRLKRAVEARWSRPLSVGLASIALALGLSTIYQVRHYGSLRMFSARVRGEISETAHSRLGSRLLAQIPPDAPVSAQSAIVPHVSSRRAVYLYPDLRDAECVLLDTTSAIFPFEIGLIADRYRLVGRTAEERFDQALQDLLVSGSFRIQDMDDGWLLFRRTGDPSAAPPSPERRFHQGELHVESWPLALDRASLTEIEVVVVNTSTAIWFPQKEFPAGFQVNLSYHWLDPSGAVVVFEGERTPLPARVHPGERVKVAVRVKSPDAPGNYVLRLELVQERVGWFEQDGFIGPSASVTVR